MGTMESLRLKGVGGEGDGERESWEISGFSDLITKHGVTNLFIKHYFTSTYKVGVSHKLLDSGQGGSGLKPGVDHF